MSDGSDPRVELGVGALIVAICLAVLWESRTIPPENVALPAPMMAIFTSFGICCFSYSLPP